jgi:hypothetical protein
MAQRVLITAARPRLDLPLRRDHLALDEVVVLAVNVARCLRADLSQGNDGRPRRRPSQALGDRADESASTENSAIRALTANFLRRRALARTGRPVNEQEPCALYQCLHGVYHFTGRLE